MAPHRLYFDYAASTPVDPRVEKVMRPYFLNRFGNPGSLHRFGQEAMAAVDAARETVAASIGGRFQSITFTGSATEANNLALQGAWRQAKKRGRNKILLCETEHESVLETARQLSHEGAEIEYLPCLADGTIDTARLSLLLAADVGVVSVMYANNETGLVQPIVEIGRIIKESRTATEPNFPVFHTDAVQAFQFFDCDVGKLNVDLMTISAHKIYGPKGIGALYVRSSAIIEPIIFGGGQEYRRWPGTENVPLIAGFAAAIDLIHANKEKEAKRLAVLKKTLWDGLRKLDRKIELNGPVEKNWPSRTLPNILNVHFPSHTSQEMLLRLDLLGLAVSAGSACNARSTQASHVLAALHRQERAAHSLRFSLGRPTTRDEIRRALAIVSKATR